MSCTFEDKNEIKYISIQKLCYVIRISILARVNFRSNKTYLTLKNIINVLLEVYIIFY